MAGNLATSIFTVAPERKAEFDTTLNNFDLIFTGERRWKLCAYPERTPSQVWISRGAVELIWCASLAHFLFYTRLIQGKKSDQPKEIDPHSDPDVSNALKLLSWAIKCQIAGDDRDDWPDGLPRPLESAAKESNENVTDELCLVTCAYFFHHELAHIRSGHASFTKEELKNPEVSALSIQQEKEADIAAAEWVLDGIDIESPIFVKRMLGIVQGFLLTTAMGLYGGNLGGRTHPFSYDRLSSLLNRFLGRHEHVAEGFGFAVLDLHFQNSGRRLTKQAYDSPKDALEAICNQLAEKEAALRNPTEQRHERSAR